MRIHAAPTDSYKWQTTSEGTVLSQLPLTTHTLYSPSSAHRWQHCPASTAPVPRDRRRPSTDASREGTAAHLLLAWVLSNLAETRAPEIPDFVAVEDRTYPTTDMIGHVRAMRQLWRDQDFVYSERSVIPFPSLADVCMGTADLILWHEADSRLTVIDFKYGRRPVEAAHNPQLILYAVGAIRLTGLQPKHVRLGIWQPRSGGLPGTFWDTDKDGLREAVIPLLQAITTAQRRPTEANAGSWCTWCNHITTCKTFLATASEVATSTDVMDDRDWQDAARFYLPIKNWVRLTGEGLKERLSDGRTYDDLKLVQGPGRRCWAAEESIIIDALPHLLDASLFEIGDCFDLKSIPAIRTMIRSSCLSDFDALVTRSSPSAIMVSSTDPRPAIGQGEEFNADADTTHFEES